MFSERLVVPWWWWAIALAVSGTFVVAIWAILGDIWAWGAGISIVALVCWGLGQWSMAKVSVDQTQLRAAGAAVEGEWISHAEVLDPGQTKDALAHAARTGDHLVLRPWLSSSVRVVLADPADPHPSWLLSTDRPQELAAAVTDLVSRRRQDHAAQ